MLLKFTLTPESCARLYDALTCVAKSNESVSLEASHDKILFTALNSSRSAYISFELQKDLFLQDYVYLPDDQQADRIFAIRMLNKALLSVFRGKSIDSRGKETGIERCEVRVDQQQTTTVSRFKVKMICRHGVTKTYRLTYEPVVVEHAVFDKGRATNKWRIASKLLREYIEYFGQKTEQLDMYLEDDQMTLNSYTEKITNGREVLKQPLQTSVTIDILDFEDLKAEENQHIGISVKDFKNMVVHASTLRASVTALYTQPRRPLQFSYSGFGLRCEFTLQTIGEVSETQQPSLTRATRSSVLAPNRSASADTMLMPPPQRPVAPDSSQRSDRLGSRNTSSQYQAAHASLFIPEDDNGRWDPAPDEYRSSDDGALGWDTGAPEGNGFQSTFRDEPAALPRRGMLAPMSYEEGIEPTQRASEIRGMFD